MNAVEGAKNLLERVKKPSDSQAKALNKLFSSSKFNPQAECVASGAHAKKKKFAAKLKKCSGTVVMLEKYQSRIPRGDLRQSLIDSNRIQSMMISRSMTPDEVKNIILATFGCEDFIILECAKGGYLLKADDQVLSSQMASDRRGALYLCENSKPLVSIDKLQWL